MRLKKSKCFYVLLIFLSGNLSAQSVDFIAGVSTSHFLGDLGGKPFLGTNDLQDLDILSTRYAITAGLRLNMGRTFALRTNLWYARVSGDDKYTRNRERHGRNLNFFSSIYEVDAVMEINVWRSADRKKIFYVFGGIGYFHFNPKTRMNGQVYELRDWGTEGQYAVAGKSPYDLNSIAYPFGFGYKFKLSKREFFSIEVNSRKSRTDYIDDVSTRYVDANLLIAAKGPTAAALADRNISDIPGFSSPGSIRGDPKDMDSFFFFSFSYNITLGAGRAGSGFGTGKRPRSNINGKRKCFEF
ncbi:MAG: hypothetical protein IT245_07905 [Bacteroidia bacterium]|nr:hypothetical protein [Bacteroidia bacterium]